MSKHKTYDTKKGVSKPTHDVYRWFPHTFA